MLKEIFLTILISFITACFIFFNNKEKYLIYSTIYNLKHGIFDQKNTKILTSTNIPKNIKN